MTAGTARPKPPGSNLRVPSPSTDKPLEFYPYGAPDLKRLHPILLRRSLFISTSTALFLALTALAITKLAIRETEIRRVVLTHDVLPLPPPIHEPLAPQIPVAPPAAPPPQGAPLPVPDAEADPEQTVPAQDEPLVSIGVGDGEGEGVDTLVFEPEGDTLPPYGMPVYVEELPEVITRVSPQYPDIARQSGIEGTVIIQALVGKDGKVKDTKVVKSIPVLDDEAVKAVKGWVFKPALVNNKPVATWVAVPVRFTLR
jgi:protein TonB